MDHREPAVETPELIEIGPPTVEDGPWDPHAEVLDGPTAGQDDAQLGAVTGDVAAGEPAQPKAPGRWRFLPKRIANRLVVGVVALVVVIVGLTGAATYAALSSFLTTRLDQQLSPVADANQRSITRCIGSGMATCILGPGNSGFHAPQKQWLVVLDEQGRTQGTVRTSADLVQMQLSKSERSAVIADPTSTRTVETNDGAVLRVTGRVVPSPNGNYIVVSGLSTSDVSHTLHRLLLLEVGIGGGAVLLALIATAYGVRLSLRPLYRVTRTARDVTAELSPEGAGLDRRVPMAHTEVDTEAGQLAESVNTLLGAVETQFAARVESEQRMRQFLADASHELRTPLTSIRGYAELARMRRATSATSATDPGGGADADTLDRIEHEGTRMSRLVEDLLMLARSDQGAAPQREVVDVGELIADAVDGARASFPQRRIDVVVPSSVAVYGDRDQLLRVLRNLVTNAAVHTKEGGPIRVSGRAEGDEIVLQVDDSGPGLPPEEAAHVFERFWRADKARTRTRGGTGLGLAIVASIVQAHGGTVRFDSAVETGSTVTIRLPAGPGSPSQLADTSGPSA